MNSDTPSPTEQWDDPHHYIASGEEVDDGSMHDPRTSVALRRLSDLTADPPTPRWSWTVARLDVKGRLGLPRDALDLLGSGPLALRWHRLAVVVEADPAGPARADGRGRLLLPPRLRSGATYLVGVEVSGCRIVLAPTTVLDAFGDALAGPGR